MTILERNRVLSGRDVDDRADWIRRQTIELIEIAGSGHYSSVFSCAEVLAALFYSILRLDPDDPGWADRDRFLLGKGHAAVGVYPCLADLGFFAVEWLRSYARLGSPLGDHPDMRRVPGIDFSSGSIGHNLSVGAGIAYGARLNGRDHRTWVLLGDGELHEGQVWEAAMAASHYRLGNLVAIIDYNKMCLDGYTDDVMGIEPVVARWEAFGWRVVEVDGNAGEELLRCLNDVPACDSDVPTCVVAHTVKGHGVPFMEDSPFWHLGFLGEADKTLALEEIAYREARRAQVPTR
jgi:transketolase